MDSFTALVIPADLGKLCRLEKVTSRAQMQSLVGGGYAEPVRVDSGRYGYPGILPAGVREDHQAILYVHENFRALPDLPGNHRASEFYPWAGGIRGDAFICGTTVDGDNCDVPAEVIRSVIGEVPDAPATGR